MTDDQWITVTGDEVIDELDSLFALDRAVRGKMDWTRYKKVKFDFDRDPLTLVAITGGMLLVLGWIMGNNGSPFEILQTNPAYRKQMGFPEQASGEMVTDFFRAFSPGREDGDDSESQS